MEWRRWSELGLAVVLAAAASSWLHGDEVRTLRLKPAVVADYESSPPPAGGNVEDTGEPGQRPSQKSGAKGPYADWPDKGMPRPAGLAERRSEISYDQAAMIAAAYADEPYRAEGHQRAGWPNCIHSRAYSSDTGRYCGYLVGGGAPRRGEAHFAHEGTWGWDYMGFWLHKRVALGWSHDRRQGGDGAYQTDGPKIRHH